MPTELFPKEKGRDRDYSRWRTFWCMIWQSLNPDAFGREVVRQLQGLFTLEKGRELSDEDGAYCRAKDLLALPPFALCFDALWLELISIRQKRESTCCAVP